VIVVTSGCFLTWLNTCARCWRLYICTVKRLVAARVTFVVHRDVDDYDLASRDLGCNEPELAAIVADLHLEHRAEQAAIFR
jgi:hypothetical protein